MSTQNNRMSLCCPRAVTFSDCFVVLVAFLHEQSKAYGAKGTYEQRRLL